MKIGNKKFKGIKFKNKIFIKLLSYFGLSLLLFSIVIGSIFGYIYACGPKPMMIAVAKRARQLGTYCEVSLENKMGCGIGACLCCVEDTIDAGHVCVCTEGPVFNIDRLKWPI